MFNAWSVFYKIVVVIVPLHNDNILQYFNILMNPFLKQAHLTHLFQSGILVLSPPNFSHLCLPVQMSRYVPCLQEFNVPVVLLEGRLDKNSLEKVYQEPSKEKARPRLAYEFPTEMRTPSLAPFPSCTLRGNLEEI